MLTYFILVALPLVAALRSGVVSASKNKVRPLFATTSFFIFATPILWGYSFFIGELDFSLVSKNDILIGMVGAIFMVSGWYLTNRSISKANLSHVAPFFNVTIIVIALLEPFIFKTNFNFLIVVAFGFMILGTKLITMNQPHKNTERQSPIHPVLLIISGACFLAFYALSSKVALSGEIPRSLYASIVATTAAAILLGLCAMVRGRSDDLSSGFLYTIRQAPVPIISAGLLTALIMVIEAHLFSLPVLSAALVIIAKRLSSIFEMTIGAVFLKEHLSPQKIFGGICFVVGGIIPFL